MKYPETLERFQNSYVYRAQVKTLSKPYLFIYLFTRVSNHTSGGEVQMCKQTHRIAWPARGSWFRKAQNSQENIHFDTM